MTETPDIFAIIGKNIRRNRKLRAMTQEQLAEQAGLSTYFVGSVERGQASLSVRSVAQIASALHVPLSAIVEGGASSRDDLARELDSFSRRASDDELELLLEVARACIGRKSRPRSS